MKTNFKNLIKAAVATMAIASMNVAEAASCQVPTVPSEVVLFSREYKGWDTSKFSFHHMSMDTEATRNNREIYFSGGTYGLPADAIGELMVNTVTDDDSYIADFGVYNCQAFAKSLEPMTMRQLRAYASTFGKDKVVVRAEHCYLSVNRDSRGEIATVFRVSEGIRGKIMLIDQITVLQDTITER